LSVGDGFDEPIFENGENELVPNGEAVPNGSAVFVFIGEMDAGANGLEGLLAPKPNEGLLDVSVVEAGARLKLLLLLVPNAN
jgi:hypothetical protein